MHKMQIYNKTRHQNWHCTIIDRGPLLQTLGLFDSFILMHKKTDVTSTMLSKDLFLCLTEAITKLCHVIAAQLSYCLMITIYIY